MMRASTTPRNQAGFTLLEVVISASVLGMILMAGAVVSKSTVESTSSSLMRSERSQQSARLLDRYQEMVNSAGRSSLLGVPVNGNYLEPMVDGVEYTNLFFRRAVGIQANAVQYDPPVTDWPYGFWWWRNPNTGAGNLLFWDGKRLYSVDENVDKVVFVKKGNVLTLTITVPPDPHGNDTGGQVVRTLVLRTP